MSGLDAGTLERKKQLLEAVLEQWGAKQGSDCHVATPQRHDVGSTMQKSTSGNVDVAKLQRRDVSSRSTPHHLKYEWLRN